MSKYTTGEMAKLCNVTVRTVQFYDTKGLLIPSDLTEGGRRLYLRHRLAKFCVQAGTIKARWLTCTKCGHAGYCVETIANDAA